MAASPSALSSSKHIPSFKHALAYDSHIPPLSGLALTLVLLLAEKVHLVLADSDDRKMFDSVLRGSVSKLLVS